nr:MAG TPA: hypothetical protein [Caudoviricetes sp.]
MTFTHSLQNIKTQQQARPYKSVPLLYMGEMDRIALTVAK